MTFQELAEACRQRTGVQLMSPNKRTPLPRKGWPRPELLFVNSNGQSVWLYDSTRLLKALERNGCL